MSDSNDAPPQTTLAPFGAEDVALGIAAMHDRAARRSADPRLRLLHEQCAVHLRSLADDPAALACIAHAHSDGEFRHGARMVPQL